MRNRFHPPHKRQHLERATKQLPRGRPSLPVWHSINCITSTPSAFIYVFSFSSCISIKWDMNFSVNYKYNYLWKCSEVRLHKHWAGNYFSRSWLAVAELGMGPEGPPLLFLLQTEAWRAEKKFWETPSPPYLRVSITLRPPPLSQGLDPALAGVLLFYRQCFFKEFRNIQNTSTVILKRKG